MIQIGKMAKKLIHMFILSRIDYCNALSTDRTDFKIMLLIYKALNNQVPL